MDKKFGWVIKDFSSLNSDNCCYSVPVLISDCKWRLLAYPKGNNCDCVSLYLDVCEAESLPCGWRKFVTLRVSIVNQHSQKLSILKEGEHCFDDKSTTWGFPEMLPLSKLSEKDSGFIVNGELMIVAELNVSEVIDTFYDVSKSNDLLKKTSLLKDNNNNNIVKQVDNVRISGLKKVLRAAIFFLKMFFVFMIIMSFVAVFENREKN